MTSTSVASLLTNTSHNLPSSSAAPSSAASGSLAATAISRALAGRHPVERVDRDPGQRLRLGGGNLLDLHAALAGGHREERPVGAIQQERRVVLLCDVARLLDQDLVDRVALDVHAEDLARLGLRVVGSVGDLDAAGLAAATGLDLRLDHDATAELGRDGASLLGSRGYLAGRDRHAMCGEEFLRLVFEEIHAPSSCRLIMGLSTTESRWPGRKLGLRTSSEPNWWLFARYLQLPRALRARDPHQQRLTPLVAGPGSLRQRRRRGRGSIARCRRTSCPA